MWIETGSWFVDKFAHLEPRSPLDGLPSVASGAGMTLRETWPFVLTQIAWRPAALKVGQMAEALGVDRVPHTLAAGALPAGNGTLLPLAPGRVLHLSGAGLSAAQATALAKLGAHDLDLSQGRVLLTLAGPTWPWVLMKGAGLDFEALAPGSVAQTPLFKIPTLVWVVTKAEACLLVPYSFARALVERLLDAGQDQGLRLYQERQSLTRQGVDGRGKY